MEYLYVTWEHDFDDEPKEIYMELNGDRMQERVLEIYEDGEIAYASLKKEFNTFLAEGEYPDIEEINSTEEFNARIITKEDFEKMWQKTMKK